MVQNKLPLINSAHGSETRNIINEIIKILNDLGYTYNEALKKSHDILNEAQQTNDMNESVQQQINTLIAESGTSDAEVLQARIDAEGNEHPVLKDRLDESDAQLADIVTIVSPSMTQSEIQNIFDTSSKIKVLSGDYFIELTNGIGLSVKSDTLIEFEMGATLRGLATDNGSYEILSVRNVENVEIVNPMIVGERSTHTGTTGEWGMGIYIQNIKNVIIRNPIANDCWGDGIYVGNYVEDLKIYNPLCDNNRRQGISIVSGKNVTIYDPVCKNTNGTQPQAGIDIEPNIDTFSLENINIINPYTENNSGNGIICSLYGISGKQDYCNIDISNHRDKGSANGLYIAYGSNAPGVITVSKPVYMDNGGTAIRFRQHEETAPKVRIENPIIINPNRNFVNGGTPSAKYDHAINILRDVGDGNTGNMGNISITDIEIVNDDKEIFADFGFYDEVETNKAGNIDISFKKFSNASIRQAYSRFGYIDLKGKLKVNDLTFHASVTRNDLARSYTNEGATGNRNLTLSSNTEIGTKVYVKLVKNSTVYIEIPGQTILGYDPSDEKIFAGSAGSGMELKKISETEWFASNVTGKWHAIET